MTTVGYGNPLMFGPFEKANCILWITVGAICFSFTLGNIRKTLMQIDSLKFYKD